MVLNVIALWKQEARDPSLTRADRETPSFSSTWAQLVQDGRTVRLLIASGLGAAAFSMQDVLLEPYGAEVLGMSVAETTRLTALSAFGSLMGFAYCSGQLSEGGEPHRLAGTGAVAGVFAFALIVFAYPAGSVAAFCLGAFLIGFGGGLFAVGTLTAVMAVARHHDGGIALGAWGAVTATATGVAVAVGGAMRDVVSGLAESGQLGPALTGPAPGYGAVYHFEILLLFATLIVIGPLARHTLATPATTPSTKFGLAAYPG